MKKSLFVLMVVLGVAVGFVIGAGQAMAGDVEPSYKADPAVYQVISENEHFRVVMATWKPGQRDKWHSHEGPLVSYRLTDCKLVAYKSDGTTAQRGGPRGDVKYNPIITKHSLENVGTADCQILIVEKK
jgi:hypothetical protein